MRRFGVQCAVWCDKWPTKEMTNGRMALPRLESLSVCAYRGGESLRCAGCGEKHGVDTTHDTPPAGDPVVWATGRGHTGARRPQDCGPGALLKKYSFRGKRRHRTLAT